MHLLHVRVSELNSTPIFLNNKTKMCTYMTLKSWSGTNFEGVEPLLEIGLLEMGRFDICDLSNPSVSLHPYHTHTHTNTCV